MSHKQTLTNTNRRDTNRHQQAPRDECDVCEIDKPDTMPRAGQFDGMELCRGCVQKIQQEAEKNQSIEVRPIIDRLKGKQREPYQFDLSEILND